MLRNTIQLLPQVQAPRIRLNNFLTWCPARRVTGNNDLKTWRVFTERNEPCSKHHTQGRWWIEILWIPMEFFQKWTWKFHLWKLGSFQPESFQTKPQISNHIDHLLPWSWLIQRPLRFTRRFKEQIEELMEHNGTMLVISVILLMEEILHHQGCIKPCQ